MKNKILTLFAVASLFVSCSDAYEVQQPGYVTEESKIFASADDIKKGIQGLYSTLPGETEVQFTSFFTDELGPGRNNSGQGVNDGSYTFILQAGNDFANNIWSNYYNVVNRANRMLSRAEVLSQTASEAELEKLQVEMAKLHALRAYSHYKLFAYFTPNYADPNGLSIIKFDFLQLEDYNRFEKRSTVAEIVAFIESDIQKAKDLGGVSGDSSIVNGAMLEAILIKMYSMVGSAAAYEKLEASFDILEEEYSKGIADAGTYASMFSGDPGAVNSSEGIFRLKRVLTDGSVTSGIANEWYAAAVNVEANNVIYMEMGRSLYNELDKLDPSKTGQVRAGVERGDIRYELNVHPDSKVVPNYASLSAEAYKANDILAIGKYTGITNRPLMNDVWMFRFSDMLLALAEKRAFEGKNTGTIALGDYSNVESIIYNIRANRNYLGQTEPVSMPTNFSSSQQSYARILEERRLEFAFEGHRYLDMKRLGVKANSPGYVRDAKDCASTNACQLEPNTFRATLPIPRAEILSNPNIVQNPGY